MPRAPAAPQDPPGSPLRRLVARGRAPFEPTADVFIGAAQRVGDAAHSVVTGVAKTLTGSRQNLGESFRDVGRGFGKTFRGEARSGLEAIALGLLDMTVGTAVDGFLMLGGKTISAVQTLLGLEIVARRLTRDEIEMLHAVFGDAIVYDDVRLKTGEVGVFGVWSCTVAFVHGDTIYVPNDDSIDRALLVHEMAHVWQHQNGGIDYMREALWSQHFGKGYDWRQSVPGTAWADLEPEQQAELLEDVFASGYFDEAGPSYGAFRFDVDGDGVGEDLTAYVEDVVAQVRAGLGAP